MGRRAVGLHWWALQNEGASFVNHFPKALMILPGANNTLEDSD